MELFVFAAYMRGVHYRYKIYKYKRRACIVTSENRLYRLFLYNQSGRFSAFADIADSSVEVYILEKYKNEEYE